ncbi:hypothetical protein RYX36_035683, partial [Vicia faba]
YSPESGHYYAYVKDAMGRWYCCDDSCVTLATLQEVLSENVYILLLSRTNPRPASVSSSLASNGVKPHHSNGSQKSESSKICRVYLRLAFDTDYVKPDPPEDVDRSKVISGTGPGNFERESNGVINKSKMLGNKRKVHEDPCNLLAHDDQSRARVEELKDSLGKEAKSVLRTCGWADKKIAVVRCEEICISGGLVRQK